MQDGSYLAELLSKGYIIYGLVRRLKRIYDIYDNSNLNLRYGDLTDSHNIINIITEIKNKNF